MTQVVTTAGGGAQRELLRVRGVSKSFQAVRALVDVDLVVHRHEVVALVGDNAAGKSTLAKVISGVIGPDSGTLELAGRPVAFSGPAQATAAGVATVFQELSLVDNLDVTANIFLGQELREGGLLAEREMQALATQYLARLNSRIPSPRTLLSSLSGGQRQCVAIARTLVGHPRLIVLDEPTASLSVTQTAEVLNHISGLRDMGLGVVFISHNLTDVRAVADRIEVMRHGRNNGSFDSAHTSYEAVIAAISGAS